jgi:hypothetical protein
MLADSYVDRTNVFVLPKRRMQHDFTRQNLIMAPLQRHGHTGLVIEVVAKYEPMVERVS